MNSLDRIPHGRISNAQQAVESAIRSLLGDLQSDLEASDLVHVCDSLRRNSTLDYDRYWREFSTSYWIANYRKSLSALRAIARNDHLDRIMDAGCGTAAGAVAGLTAAAERRVEVRDVVLLDRSGQQLGTAERFVLAAASALGHDLGVQVVHGCVETYSSPKKFGLVIASHVLTEQPRVHVAAAVENLVGQLRPGGQLLAVERGDDEPWAAPEFAIPPSIEPHYGRFQVCAPIGVGPKRGRTWEASYFLATPPEATWVASLIDRYFEAWAKQDVLMIPDIFSKDAVYHEKPFDEPLVGVHQIEDYWRSHVEPQFEPRIERGSPVFGRLRACVPWSATFELGAEVRNVRGLMMFSFDPIRQQIASLCEVFHTQTGTSD